MAMQGADQHSSLTSSLMLNAHVHNYINMSYLYNNIL